MYVVLLFWVFFIFWPITLFEFGLKELKTRPIRAIFSLLLSLFGFLGYLEIPYWLLSFSNQFLPVWTYTAIPLIYIVGGFLSFRIDDRKIPLIL